MIPSAQPDLPDNSVSGAPRFQSAMFRFPGRPLPLARRLAVYNRVKRILRDFMADQRFNEVPAPAGRVGAYLGRMIDRGFPAVWAECQIESGEGGPAGETRSEMIGVLGADLDQDALIRLERALLEAVVKNLNANLLGGRQITRLDRVLTCEHPRIGYDEAGRILTEHGHPVAPGASIATEDQAALARLCHNQPVLVTEIPAGLADSWLQDDVQPNADEAHHACLLPYAGLTIIGSVLGGDDGRGGFTLNLGRLLQFLMGLESVRDTVISPRR